MLRFFFINLCLTYTNLFLIVGRLIYCQCVVLLVIVVSFYACSQKISEEQDHEDRVSLWLDQTHNSSPSVSEKKAILDSAYVYTQSLPNDSIKRRHLSAIAYRAYQIGDSILFKTSNQKALHLATVHRDTTVWADAHWNYGAFYLQQEIYDSSYYHYNKALELYQLMPDPYYAGKMLYNMAIVHSRLKDYTACEVLLFQAISILEPLHKYKQLYYCYNLLGIVYYELKEPDKAFDYYRTAIKYLEKLDDTTLLKAHLNNNIGILFQDQKDFPRALSYFNTALKMPGLQSANMALYARLKDNIAYTRLLMKDATVQASDFYRPLHIRDSLDNQSGVVTSMLHLAAYYAFNQDTLQSIALAKEALDKGREIQNNSEILKSLQLLSEIDNTSGNHYLREFMALTKSIHVQERKVRDKFARVQYETDKYIERTQKLSSQRIWIISISAIIILLLTVTYISYRQFARNKMLNLENQKQYARNKLLNLENRKHKDLQEERERISKVLHSQVLGDLAGIRLSWFRLPLSGAPEVLQQHKDYIEKLREFERHIRDASHKLHENAWAIENNLIGELEKLLKTRCEAVNLNYHLYADQDIPWIKVLPKTKTYLYNIVEEGLRNCIIHAQAQHIAIQFVYRDPEIHLTIEDNGKGIRKLNAKKGIGLYHIQSNVKELQGSFQIKSKPGKGTALHILIPISKMQPNNEQRKL